EIVYTMDKYGNREAYNSDGEHEIQIPLVVLVNGNSASASEILAGAIKDYEKGTLFGTTTYGKGIVQRIFDFEDGTGVKLTVSDYYTPKGNNIHEVGIEPDVVLEFDAEAYEKDETDNQLEEAKTLVLDMIQ
ncbi:MAG: S41 family peptidase, partial [Lachnospiraceae bacterium]|nr:S41 family peptidase [Lachnospiraceae bacterium]